MRWGIVLCIHRGLRRSLGSLHRLLWTRRLPDSILAWIGILIFFANTFPLVIAEDDLWGSVARILNLTGRYHEQCLTVVRFHIDEEWSGWVREAKIHCYASRVGERDSGLKKTSAGVCAKSVFVTLNSPKWNAMTVGAAYKL